MDIKTFWLLGCGIITFGGAALIFARRYNNRDTGAGGGIAWLIGAALIIWVIGGVANLLH